MKACAA